MGIPLSATDEKRKSYPRVAFFSSVRGEKHAPCGACAGDSKGRAYRPGPLRIDQLLPLRGSPARLRRAFVVLIRFRLSRLLRRPMHQFVSNCRACPCSVNWSRDPFQLPSILSFAYPRIFRSILLSFDFSKLQ